jgi:hypothetical protein
MGMGVGTKGIYLMRICAFKRRVYCRKWGCARKGWVKAFEGKPLGWSFVCLDTENVLFFCGKHFVSLLIEDKKQVLKEFLK